MGSLRILVCAVVALTTTTTTVAAQERQADGKRRWQTIAPRGDDRAALDFRSPAPWKPTARTGRSVSFDYAFNAGCAYRITVRSALSADRDESARARVGRLQPAGPGYIIARGSPGDASYRVVFTGSSNGDDPATVRAILSTRRTLAPGRRAWHDTRVSATQKAGRDNCFTGSYASAIGPQTARMLSAAQGRVLR